MRHTVEVRDIGTDLAQVIAIMRSWLDHNGIGAKEFAYSSGGPGIAFRLAFSQEGDAEVFAKTFGGRFDRHDHPNGEPLWPVINRTASPTHTAPPLRSSGSPRVARNRATAIALPRRERHETRSASEERSRAGTPPCLSYVVTAPASAASFCRCRLSDRGYCDLVGPQDGRAVQQR
jgi:hypothetical protein